MHAPGGMSPQSQQAADPRLGPCGHRDRRSYKPTGEIILRFTFLHTIRKATDLNGILFPEMNASVTNTSAVYWLYCKIFGLVRDYQGPKMCML